MTVETGGRCTNGGQGLAALLGFTKPGKVPRENFEKPLKISRDCDIIQPK